MDENRRLRVFLCHSSVDKPIVRDLYKTLSLERWIEPWLDEVMLKPGQDWQLEIEKAVDQSDVVIVCLSQNSITKEGYVQKEIRKALDKAEEKPEETIFIIPLRLEECDVPKRLAKWHWEDYFKENSYSRLIESLRLRGEKLGISLVSSERYALISSLRKGLRERKNLELLQDSINKAKALYAEGSLPNELSELFLNASEFFDKVAELEAANKSLTIKETELKAVIAQGDLLANSDDLTLLPNRRQILSDLQREVLFSKRYSIPLSIAMIDLDQFRQINDTYGQMIGEDILRSLASEIRQLIRYPNMIGRYGGEEFLLVLPHLTGITASELTEQICQQIRSISINLGKYVFRLTVSIGVAEYKRPEDWSELLERVDQALIKAKRNGRDQWIIYEES